MDDRLIKILTEPNNNSNKDLEYALKTLREDFDTTKDLILRLTKHLDGLELNYEKLLKEYKSRK
jgi:argininosuccinate lyase